MNLESRKLNVAVLGCGPIAQFAHFESCQKGRNVELYAICDRAPDLLKRMNAIWQPHRAYADLDELLADENVEAVIVATADAFHVPLALRCVEAGKHVMVEKPLSDDPAACYRLHKAAERHGVHVQIGHMKRFDPGIEFAKNFVTEKLGEIIAFKGWYCDNVQRYTFTDNVQPLPVRSQFATKPTVDPKADLEYYYMMAHGSHLIDTAIHLVGPIARISAQLRNVRDAYCWFVQIEFANGTLGHLDLTIKLRADWHEGFTIYGEHGSVFAKTPNPWFYQGSEVECYYEPEQQYHRSLAVDGFSYRRQLEHFADVILNKVTPKGTNTTDAAHIAAVMRAVWQSSKSGGTMVEF